MLTLMFFQLWPVIAFRNCKVVLRVLANKTKEKHMSMCIMWPVPSLTLGYENEPPFTTPTSVWSHLMGREVGAQLSRLRYYPVSMHSCRAFWGLHDILDTHNWCGWRAGTGSIASAEGKVRCSLCTSVKTHTAHSAENRNPLWIPK